MTAAATRRWTPSAVVVAAATLTLGATACGDDEPVRSTARTTTGSQATTTSITSTTVSYGGTTVAPAAPPIPTDPATLGSCDAIAPRSSFSLPSRRWPGDLDGFEVQYAYTTGIEATTTDQPAVGQSSLARVPGESEVDAMASVWVSDASASPEASNGLQATGTARGVPVSIGPETTRGGATGATNAAWIEDGQIIRMTVHGLDERHLASFIEALRFDDGVVTGAPATWRIVGTARPRGDAPPQLTVIGLTHEGEPLSESGAAPVELRVVEPPAGSEPPSGPLPVAMAVDRIPTTLRTVGGHLALLAELSTEQTTSNSVDTTDRDGNPITAIGAASFDELVRLATGTRAIDVDDPLLVGVPMASVAASPGAWCREDR